MVIVLVYVQVEGGVAVYIVWPETRPQGLLNGLISQPLLQLRRPTHIVDDALREHVMSSVSRRCGFRAERSKGPVML